MYGYNTQDVRHVWPVKAGNNDLIITSVNHRQTPGRVCLHSLKSHDRSLHMGLLDYAAGCLGKDGFLLPVHRSHVWRQFRVSVCRQTFTLFIFPPMEWHVFLWAPLERRPRWALPIYVNPIDTHTHGLRHKTHMRIFIFSDVCLTGGFRSSTTNEPDPPDPVRLHPPPPLF